MRSTTTIALSALIAATSALPVYSADAGRSVPQAVALSAEPEIEKQTWEPVTVSAARLERDPEGLAVREFKRAVKHLRKKRFAQSLEHLDRARAIDPDFADAYLNAGVARLGLRQPERAVAEFERAIALDARLLFARANLALVQLRVGNHSQAESAARGALKQNSKDIRANYALGMSRAAQGVFDEETMSSLRRAAEKYTNAQRALAAGAESTGN